MFSIREQNVSCGVTNKNRIGHLNPRQHGISRPALNTGENTMLASNMEGSQNTDLNGAVLQFATFHLNSELFGINILQVQEIQLPQPVTAVPRAASHIKGLISLRGQIVTLVDLRKRLRMDESEPIETPYHIVVKTPSTMACMEVGAIGDVVNVPAEDFRPPPESVHEVDRKFLEGVYSMPAGILTILKISEVLEAI